MKLTVSEEGGINLMEKEENTEKADSNKSQTEQNSSVDSKISEDDNDRDFSPTKISRGTEDSTIHTNNDDTEDITSSLSDLSIKSPGNLDITSL